MGLTRGACLHCQLPSLPRALLIPKGRQSLFHLAISRNGRVLFLSEQPLAELVDMPVYVLVRPWPDCKNGTIVQIRLRRPWQRPVLAAAASVLGERPTDALLALPLSPRGALVIHLSRTSDDQPDAR